LNDIPKTPIPLERITIGMKALCTKTICDQDIRAFAELSGDKNPIHLDEDFASSSRYKRRIAHGLFSASLFSSLFGTQLPGYGCVYVSQSLKFKRPVYIGDKVTATVLVVNVSLQTRLITFDTICTVRKKTVIEGSAVLYIPQ
tara:strand:+ start:194 stop:622 length:429 start_codon:yes stop_codon:yes gene_type:complete